MDKNFLMNLSIIYKHFTGIQKLQKFNFEKRFNIFYLNNPNTDRITQLNII